MQNRETVHVVDEDAARRASLVRLIERAGYHVHAYASADALRAAGCDLGDPRIPGTNRPASEHGPESDSVVPPLVLIAGGGAVCCEDPFDFNTLMSSAAAGSLCQQCNSGAPDDSETARQGLRGLTRRERDVLQHLVAGDSNKAVACKLGVSPRTIEFHRARIMSKTGARGLPDLVRWWLAAHSSRSEGLPGRPGQTFGQDPIHG